MAVHGLFLKLSPGASLISATGIRHVRFGVTPSHRRMRSHTFGCWSSDKFLVPSNEDKK